MYENLSTRELMEKIYNGEIPVRCEDSNGRRRYYLVDNAQQNTSDGLQTPVNSAPYSAQPVGQGMQTPVGNSGFGAFEDERLFQNMPQNQQQNGFGVQQMFRGQSSNGYQFPKGSDFDHVPIRDYLQKMLNGM